MLNTATWTTATGNGTAMQMFALAPDFDYQEELDTVPATSLTHPSGPEPKPYVYGDHRAMANRLRAVWNQTHPNDPMPED